jgi:hypothetical protein
MMAPKAQRVAKRPKGRAKTVTNIAHAYSQAPWRQQLQYVGMFLLGLVGMVLIAGVYLYVTSRATAAGARIQELEQQRQDMLIEISQLRTDLGELTAADLMEERARQLGYQKADIATAIYFVVPNYPGREVALLAPPPVKSEPQTVLLPAYRESLWELLMAGTLPFLEAQGVMP